MYCTDPGHEYQLTDGQTLRFIKKEKNEATGTFDTVWVGTTNEELLEVLIDRTTGLNAKLPSAENIVAIDYMKKALAIFEARTAARKRQNVEATPEQHQPDHDVIDRITEPTTSVIIPSRIGAHDGSAFPETLTDEDRKSVFSGMAAGAGAAALAGVTIGDMQLRPHEVHGDVVQGEEPPQAVWPFPGREDNGVQAPLKDDPEPDADSGSIADPIDD